MNRFVPVLLVALAFSFSANAKEVEFDPVMKAGQQELAYAGSGVLSKWFIKGCDIALYVNKDTTEKDVLADTPRCLEFHYYRVIKAEQFAVAAWDTLRKNWPENVLAKEKKNIDKLHEIYQDVKKDDRYKLIYLPGKGTELFLNGKSLGTVEGQKFAELYFSIWLGKVPINAKLKQELTAGLK